MLRDRLRGFFKWKIVSVFGVGVWFTGLGLTLSTDHPVPAIVCVSIGGTWLLGWWIVTHPMPRKSKNHSDWTNRRKAKIQGRRIGIVGIVALNLVLIAANILLEFDQSFQRFQRIRDDIADNLSVQPLPPILNARAPIVPVTIENGSHWDIGTHVIGCVIIAMYDTNMSGFGNSFDASPTQFSRSLLGGHRGETVNCPASMVLPMYLPVRCADIEIRVSFFAKEQSAMVQKDYRFSYGTHGTQGWTKENNDIPGDYCSKRGG